MEHDQNGENPWAGEYWGVLKVVNDRRRGYGFISIDTVRPLNMPLPESLPMTSDFLLHVAHNRALGDPLPRLPTAVVFRVRPDAHSKSKAKIQVYDAHITTGLPCYKGRINKTVGMKGYSFIGWDSIEHVSGAKIVLPTQDLMIHVQENRGLPDPIPYGLSIVFFAHMHRGEIEVFGAEVDSGVSESTECTQPQALA